mgnify:CR=1 FL=1
MDICTIIQRQHDEQRTAGDQRRADEGGGHTHEQEREELRPGRQPVQDRVALAVEPDHRSSSMSRR